MSVLSPLPTLGLGTTDQAVPSQCSINVWAMPLGRCVDPTAQMSSAVNAATASKALSPTPTLGLGTTRHWIPVQCWIRVWDTLTGWDAPTAHTSSGATAARLFSTLSPVPLLGLETTLQPGRQVTEGVGVPPLGVAVGWMGVRVAAGPPGVCVGVGGPPDPLGKLQALR